MASISSTTSSLGNTSLRGFGGMASGIDRDAIIEKMTLGTTTKINNQKNKMTQLQWKQEAYQSVIDKIFDWSDTYASYASTKNLIDPTVFTKNQITVHGKEDSTNLVSVTGSSDLIDTVSILGVMGTASSAVLQSGSKTSDEGLEMRLEDLAKTTYQPGMFDEGAKLYFDTVAKDGDGKAINTIQFELKSSYTLKDGDKVIREQPINYAPQTEEEYEELAKALNELLKETKNEELNKMVSFEADGKSIKIVQKGTGTDGENRAYELRSNYASEALGYNFDSGNGIKLSELTSANVSKGPLKLVEKSVLDSIAGEKLIFEYNGSQKSIELITAQEAAELKNMTMKDAGFDDAVVSGIATSYGLDGTWDENSKIFDLYNALSEKLYETDSKLNRPAELQAEIEDIEKYQEDFDKRIKDELGIDLSANPNGLTDKIKELEDEIKAKADEITDLDADIAAETDPVEKAKLEEERKKLEDEKAVSEGNKKTFETVKEERERLQRELEKVRDDKQAAEDELAAPGSSGATVKDDLEALKSSLENQMKAISGKQSEQAAAKVSANIENRLGQAFGTGAVTVSSADGRLSFKAGDDSGTISVLSNNISVLNTLGVEYGASNKVNLDGKLTQAALKLDVDANGLDEKYMAKDTDGNATDALDLVINGKKIGGLTKNSTVGEILSAINSTKDVGVKATYVEATGTFMLVSSETGKGRQINLDSDLAKDLFGDGGEGSFKDGTNAQVLVSYGNGVEVMVERSSNTFNLEGLTVTVSGEFGDVEASKDADGKVTGYSYTKGAAVTFSAKADVDGALERVKAFIEEYNALVTEINNQITTRPNSDYGPLTDEQKKEMDDTSIENWEKKAKQGMLYGDAAMRDLSMDVQSVITKMMSNGADYERDLKAIGITYSDDWGDGGILVFDETKFREAMENDPEKVSNVFTGGGNIKKGLINTINDTFTPYATRYANKNGNGGKGSYGRLVEIAGTEKKPTTLMDNEIYRQLKEMQEIIDSLNDRLKVEQDRYISQFTTMETLLNQMNTQSSYLSQLTA